MVKSASDFQRESQEELIRLLSTDIDLAFTFLKTAEIEADHDPAHSQSALEKAQRALESVRRFEPRIQSEGTSREIHSHANELEEAIQKFGK